MKNKLLLIGAIGFMTIISAPAFSQNSVPANTASTAKQTARVHVKPVSPEKETPVKQSDVIQSSNTSANTGKFHSRVQPVSAEKKTATAPSTGTTVAAKPIHPHVKPVSATSTVTNSTSAK